MNLLQKQFYALYEEDLPREILLEGTRYKHKTTFKYDFFAGTGLYELADPASENEHKEIVVKIYRLRRFFLLPMRWMGILSVRHESRLYQKVDDLQGIPKLLGFVGKTGFAHEFIPGKQLSKSDTVDSKFFDELADIIRNLHQRQVAYVDLNKPENIILGENGKPYLVDFQISFSPKRNWPVFRHVNNIILHQLQTEDNYHFAKHKRKLRPDLLTPEDYALTYKRSIPIKIHRVVSRPYFAVRHMLMDLLDLTPAE